MTRMVCRSGDLFRVQIGAHRYALKVYAGEERDGYANERRFLQTLASSDVPVPRVVGNEDGNATVRPWLMVDWLDGDGDLGDPIAFGRHLGTTIGRVHAHALDDDWHAFGRAAAAHDRQRVERLPEPAPIRADLDAFIDEWLAVVLTQPVRAVLIHGDLGLDNLVVDRGQIVGLFDSGWCIAGHPLMDIGYVLNSRADESLKRAFCDCFTFDAPALLAFRRYLYVGKLLHQFAVGNRERYDKVYAALRAL